MISLDVFRKSISGMRKKIIPCGDSLFVILFGVVVAISGIGNSILLLPRMKEFQGEDGQDDSRLLLYCEIFAFVFAAIISGLVNQSCVDLNEMQAKIDNLDRKDEFCRTFREIIKGYLLEGVKWIDMSRQRQCSYNQHRRGKEINIIIGEPIPLHKTSDGATFVPMDFEMRGITLRQLKAIDANATRRCAEEKWVDGKGNRVTPETMTMYDIHKYVVKPFTKHTQGSFVECLPSTAGTQPPRIYISYWRGNPFKDTIACIEQMVEDFKWNRNDEDDKRGGGMTEDTPICICIFAYNIWVLEEDMGTEPTKAAFVRAMEISSFRTMSILDSQCIAFTRLWMVFETFLTLKNSGLWAIYTAHKHSVPFIRKTRSAIGIVLGGAPGEAADDTYIREESFPPEMIFHVQRHQINVVSANASVMADKTRILNSVIGRIDLDAPPPTTHEEYNKVDNIVSNAIQGAFAASVPALKATLPKEDDDNTEEDEQWKDMLVTLSKGTQIDTFKLDFRAFDNPTLTSIRAHELISHLPPTYTGLLFSHATGDTAIGMIHGTIEWLAKAKEMKELICFNCKVGDGEEGRRLGSQLANELTESTCTETIEDFYMTNTDLIMPGNITEWAAALKRMKNLKILYLDGVEISEEDEKILRDATHESAVTYFKKRMRGG